MTKYRVNRLEVDASAAIVFLAWKDLGEGKEPFCEHLASHFYYAERISTSKRLENIKPRCLIWSLLRGIVDRWSQGLLQISYLDLLGNLSTQGIGLGVAICVAASFIGDKVHLRQSCPQERSIIRRGCAGYRLNSYNSCDLLNLFISRQWPTPEAVNTTNYVQIASTSRPQILAYSI